MKNDKEYVPASQELSKVVSSMVQAQTMNMMKIRTVTITGETAIISVLNETEEDKESEAVETTEICLECETEVEVKSDTLKAECPVCHRKLMLYSICRTVHTGDCNYDTATDTCRFRQFLIFNKFLDCTIKERGEKNELLM